MRHLNAIRARRWRKVGLGGFLLLWGLVGMCLPACLEQARSSGGHILTQRQAAQKPASPAAAAPKAAPATPSSFSPDNDIAYPSYNPGAGLTRPLPFPAALPPYGVSPFVLPWNRPGFEEYNELPRMPPFALVEARKYSLAATLLPPPPVAERPTTAVLIAHLPEHAAFWVEGTRTRSLGRTRYFQSPPLLPGREYVYTVRAAWVEDGRWVSRSRKVPVRAGTIQAIYLQLASLPSPARSVREGGPR